MSNPPISEHNEPKRKKRERKKDDRKKVSAYDTHAHTCHKLNLMERTMYRVYINMNSFTIIRRLNDTNLLADPVTA